jgi:hypothetical protein
MASKVNVKFVSMLAAGLIGAFALVAGATYYLVTNSATDLARMGDKAVAEGKYDDAVIYYSKAVFKEKTNSEYLGKWRDSLRKLSPPEQVRAAWRARVSDAHPDRARSRGLPDDFIAVAESKTAAINAAYDTVTRERRDMALEGAA